MNQTISQANISKNVPKLRFSEFKNEWYIRDIKSLFDRIVDKNIENNKNVLTVSAQYGLINQENFFKKSVAASDVSGYYLLKKNDFAYNKSYSNGYPMGAIKRLNIYEKGIVSTLYICFRSKPGNITKFFEYYFDSGLQNKELTKITQEGARNHGLLNISIDDFFSIKLRIPNLNEQQKIADFLTVVDEKISALDKKVTLLKKYKKGIMQKIFSQEIRFKDENGNEYPEWEEKKLGELFKIGSGHDYKHLTKGDIPVYGTGGLMLYVNEYLYDGKSVCIGRKGTIDKPQFLKGKFWTVDTLFFTYDYKNSIPEFIFLIFQRINWRKFNEASGVPSLSKTTIEKIKTKIPKFKEQQKIADFLTSLNDIITLEKKKLEQAKKFKKSLLQQMFI